MGKEALVLVTEMAAVHPDYRLLAAPLLDEMRAFYSDPENERAFQEWKAARNRKEVKRKNETAGAYFGL